MSQTIKRLDDFYVSSIKTAIVSPLSPAVFQQLIKCSPSLFQYLSARTILENVEITHKWCNITSYRSQARQFRQNSRR